MKLGVIGCGKMGSALVGGIIESGICMGRDTFVHDTYAPAAEALAEKTGGQICHSNLEVVENAEIILLCVKPQGMIESLEELGTDVTDRLLISIAAGVTIDTIESAIENRHRVIRVMPNTPSLVGRGAAGFACGKSATKEDSEWTSKLLGAVGYVCQVEESDLDAVTALSGSGPAYLFLMIESLVKAAVEQGLDPTIAKQLAAHTVAGSAEMVLQTDDSPTQLRENVTSPNGTTFAALESFRSNQFESIVAQALDAARDRSIELGKR